jgi:hypothetical protein
MNSALVRDFAPAILKAERQLAVAASMLSAAAPHQVTATTVVGVLGYDDVDAFRSLVMNISADYGLEPTVTIRDGAYSVRLSRRSVDATRW